MVKREEYSRVVSWRLRKGQDRDKFMRNMRKIAKSLGYTVRRGPMAGWGNIMDVYVNLAFGKLGAVRIDEDANMADAVRALYVLKKLGADIVVEGNDIITVSWPDIGTAAELALEATEFPYDVPTETETDEAEADAVMT